MTKEEILNREYTTQCAGNTSLLMRLFPEKDKQVVLAAMDEYAKQQAIAFAIDYAKRKLTWLKELRQQPNPDDVEDDRMEVRYDQFIEQQNK